MVNPVMKPFGSKFNGPGILFRKSKREDIGADIDKVLFRLQWSIHILVSKQDRVPRFAWFSSRTIEGVQIVYDHDKMGCIVRRPKTGARQGFAPIRDPSHHGRLSLEELPRHAQPVLRIRIIRVGMVNIKRTILFCRPQRDQTLSVAVNTAAHRTGSPVCGPKPGKEPPQLIDRAVLIAIHAEAAVPTAIRALPQRHGLRVPTAAAGLARMAFILDFQHVPSQETLVAEHLHETIQPPIVVDTARCRL